MAKSKKRKQSAQQKRFAQAGRKASSEGHKPGTKAFGARVKELLKK